MAAAMMLAAVMVACTDESPRPVTTPTDDSDIIDDVPDPTEPAGGTDTNQQDDPAEPLPHELVTTMQVDADDDVVLVDDVRQHLSLDPEDGSVRWQLPYGTRPMAAPGAAIVESLIDEGRSVEVVDAVTGQTRFEVLGVPYGTTSDLVITCRPPGDDDPPGWLVDAHDLDSGDLAWSSSGWGCTPPAVVADGTVAISDNRAGPGDLRILDPSDGEERDRVAASSLDRPVSAGEIVVVPTDDGLVVVDGETRTLDVDAIPVSVTDSRLLAHDTAMLRSLDLADGTVVWEEPFDAERRDLAIDADREVVLIADGEAGEVTALDPATGEPSWTVAVEATDTIGLATHDGIGFVATPTAVVSIDLATGEVRWSTPLDGG